MKRLRLVAIGVAFCALATGADARSGRMHLGMQQGNDFYAGGDWESTQHDSQRKAHVPGDSPVLRRFLPDF